MRHLAAYLLLQIGGNANPNAKDIKKLLGTVGIEADADRIEKLLDEVKGKDLNALISEGSAKLASVPSGGAVSAGTTGGAPTASVAAEPKAEDKKEESEKEESDEDMGFGLFD